MLSFWNEVTISDRFRDLFKRQKYEEYVFTIISRSKRIFKDVKFYKIESQSAGEPDYLDQFGNKYDAKLLFNTEQGRLIGEKKNDLKEWVYSMIEECSQFGELINKRNQNLIVGTELYKIMRNMVYSLTPDENGIFFIPYPVSLDVSSSIFLQFATDYLQAVYNRLEEEKIIGEHKIFFIYPSMEESVYVLRDNDFHREYISVPELDSFITFKISIR